MKEIYVKCTKGYIKIFLVAIYKNGCKIYRIKNIYLESLFSGFNMGLNELYDEVRKPLPKKLKQKKELYEKYRIRKYDGAIDSPDYQVKKEYLLDIETAIKVQIENRFRAYTIITTFSALIVILDIILRLIKVII